MTFKSNKLNPLSNWHANLLTLQRRNCILLVHDETRFPLLLSCLTKPDFAALDYHFADALMNTLLKLGADEEQLQTAQDLLAPVCIDKAFDRSVQGNMNQMGLEIEHRLHIRMSVLAISAPTAQRCG